MRCFEVIIAGVDLSPLSASVLSAAGNLARRTGAREIHAVHVVAELTAAARMRGAGAHALEELEERTLSVAHLRLDCLRKPSGAFTFTRELRCGSAAIELARSAHAHRADLIVVATHGYSAVHRALVGSVATEIARIAPCAVLVVGGGDGRRGLGELRRIVAAVDLSPLTSQILDHATALCDRSDGTVRALSVVGPAGESPDEGGVIFYSAEDADRIEKQQFHRLEELIAARAPSGPRIIPEIEHAIRPAPAILSVAQREDADLLVIGASGHKSWHRLLLGSTAAKVLSGAGCPVLVVPDPAKRRSDLAA